MVAPRNLCGRSDLLVYAQALQCHVQLFVTLWTVARQAPLSMGFSRQEYWSGCHALFQGIFLTQGSNQHLLCLLHCKQLLYCWATGKAKRCPRNKQLALSPGEAISMLRDVPPAKGSHFFPAWHIFFSPWPCHIDMTFCYIVSEYKLSIGLSSGNQAKIEVVVFSSFHLTTGLFVFFPPKVWEQVLTGSVTPCMALYSVNIDSFPSHLGETPGWTLWQQLPWPRQCFLFGC